MSTQPQIHANRLNAQKSTGPKTQKGKEIVAQNALKHGLSARCDVVITESQADFDIHRDSLLEELAPQGPMESMLADRIVSLSWRLKRADLIQNQTIDAMHEANKSNPLTKLVNSFGLKGLQPPHPPNPDLTLGRIALKDFSNARVLDRLLMYERRIENSLHKTLQELQRLTLIRNLAPSDQIEFKSPRLARGPVPRVPTEKNKTTVRHTPYHIHTIIPPIAQNKPKSKTTKIPATSLKTRVYTNFTPRSIKKNKPNQTQSITVKPPAKPDSTFPNTRTNRRGAEILMHIGTQSCRRETLGQAGFPRSAHNKLLAIAPGIPHNACHTVENGHKP